jgi:hypothetical protein
MGRVKILDSSGWNYVTGRIRKKVLNFGVEEGLCYRNQE